MTAVKERIIGAVSIMSDKDADIFWHIIQKHFTAPDLFANIEEVGVTHFKEYENYNLDKTAILRILNKIMECRNNIKSGHNDSRIGLERLIVDILNM